MERRVKLNSEIRPVSEYEGLIETIEVLSDVRTAVQQIEAGQAISNGDAKAELRSRFSR
jgi:hypothetical protein